MLVFILRRFHGAENDILLLVYCYNNDILRCAFRDFGGL